MNKQSKCYIFFLYFLDRSTTKQKTSDPSWNEYFIHEVHNAKNIGLTVFHDAAIPPDDFVANCTILFEDLAHRDKEQQDFWVRFFFILLLSYFFFNFYTRTIVSQTLFFFFFIILGKITQFTEDEESSK